MKITTIKIYKGTKDMLDLMKVHPRQSYDEVIKYLIKEDWENVKKIDWSKNPPKIRISKKEAKELGL